MFFFFSPSLLETDIFLVVQDEYEILDEDRILVKLDGFDENEYRKLRDQMSSRDLIQELNTFRFYFELKGNFAKNWQSIYSNRFNARRWMRLYITNIKSETQVLQIHDNAEIAQTDIRFIREIDFMPTNNFEYHRLNKLLGWDDFSETDPDVIADAFNFSGAETHFNVYDVGQGSFNGIVNPQGMPLSFADVGGGQAFNAHTYQNTLQVCTKHVNSIVISHWDIDHLETARRYKHRNWSLFSGKNWIVPQQRLTPSYKKLAVLFATTGTLMVWPRFLARIRTGSFEISKCFGPDKNHSGLAVVLHSSTNKILYPGDAAYMYVPKRTSNKISGLIATHHGAEFPLNNAPVPICKKGKIAYSYGNGNSYGHPRMSAVTAHHTNGWSNRLDTNGGNISFNVSGVPCNSSCSQALCDLDTSQHF